MKMKIRHYKIYQDDLEWREVQDYVKQLQKLHYQFGSQKQWQDFVNTGHEIENWFQWFGILQNWHDTDWAVDPVSGSRIW